MTRVLLITDHFPPKHDIATLRSSAISKYLDPTQFEIYIFTDGIGAHTDRLRRVSNRWWLMPSDFTVSRNWLIHKTKALWNRILRQFIADQNPGFYANGKEAAIHWMLEKRFNVVISSYSSLGSMRLGLALKTAFPKTYWICDFRDHMSQNQNTNFWMRIRLKSWEKRFLRAADHVVAVSKPILDYFRELNPKIPGLEMRNGYDFEPIREWKPKAKTFEIVYAGSLYNIRNLTNFFAGWKALPDGQREKIRLKVIGAKRPEYVPQAFRQWVEVLPPVPYGQMPAVLAASDAFLLINPAGPWRGVFTGKLFDYLAVNRPIIGLVDPNDAAADLIQKTNSGYVIANENIAGISQLLAQALKDWGAGKTFERRWDIVEQHHRRTQVNKLESSLSEISFSPF